MQYRDGYSYLYKYIFYCGILGSILDTTVSIEMLRKDLYNYQTDVKSITGRMGETNIHGILVNGEQLLNRTNSAVQDTHDMSKTIQHRIEKYGNLSR